MIINWIWLILSTVLAFFICKMWFSNSFGTMGAYIKYAVIIWFVCCCVVLFIFNKLGLMNNIEDKKHKSTPQVTQESVSNDDSEISDGGNDDTEISDDSNDDTEVSYSSIVDSLNIYEEFEVEDINGSYFNDENETEYIDVNISDDGQEGSCIVSDTSKDTHVNADLYKISNSLYEGVSETGVKFCIAFGIDDKGFVTAETGLADGSITRFYLMDDEEE